MTRNLVASAQRAALARLREYGITDRIVVKLKDMRGDWVAMYRGGTQFTGRGRGPIIWIDPRGYEGVDDVLGELTATTPKETPT